MPGAQGGIGLELSLSRVALPTFQNPVLSVTIDLRVASGCKVPGKFDVPQLSLTECPEQHAAKATCLAQAKGNCSVVDLTHMLRCF